MTAKPGTNAKHDIDAQIRCARRELTMRKKVYLWRVSNKKMTQDQAHYEIGAMEAILDTLEAVKALHWPDAQGGLGI